MQNSTKEEDLIVISPMRDAGLANMVLVVNIYSNKVLNKRKVAERLRKVGN